MKQVFGRQRELAAVGELLSEARARYAVLVVEGEAGIGKTTVWTEASRLGAQAGFRVLSCRPAQTETKLAFASLSDLLGPIEEEVLRQLAEPQRLALEVALLRASPGAGPSDPRAVATALLAILQRLSDISPVLVTIDDAQWMDRASGAALSFALRRLDPGRAVGLLVGMRIEGGREADRLGLGQLTPARLERIRLGPLNLSVLYHVLKAELGLVFPRPTLQRIEQESGGNPFFALELARALRDSGERPGPGERLSVPGGLAELLKARVANLPTGARDALLVSALVSRPTGALVTRVLGPAAESSLEQAWLAGVIEIGDEGISFTHPLYAATVSSSALPDKRRAFHRRLATLVDDPEEQARHLALATTAADESVADRLEEGAALARLRGAWGAAAELLERARELTPVERVEEAQRRGILAAEHHVRAGDRARGRGLVEEVLAGPLPPGLRADALRLLGEISYDDENAVHARQLFEQALDYAEDAQLIARIELGLCTSSRTCSTGARLPSTPTGPWSLRRRVATGG